VKWGERLEEPGGARYVASEVIRNPRETLPTGAGRQGGTPPGVQGFCLPSTSKFSMLAGTKLMRHLPHFGENIQASPFRTAFNPCR
jgi:hypothetical protein